MNFLVLQIPAGLPYRLSFGFLSLLKNVLTFLVLLICWVQL